MVYVYDFHIKLVKIVKRESRIGANIYYVNYLLNKISEYNKLRFSSKVDLPLDTLIQFRALIIAINCVIEKDGEYHPEIYLDEGLYEADIV